MGLNKAENDRMKALQAIEINKAPAITPEQKAELKVLTDKANNPNQPNQ